MSRNPFTYGVPQCSHCHKRLVLTKEFLTLYYDKTPPRWAYIEVTCSECLEEQPGLGYIDPMDIYDWLGHCELVLADVSYWAINDSDTIVLYREELKSLDSSVITIFRKELGLRPEPLPRPSQSPYKYLPPVVITCEDCHRVTRASPITDDILWFSAIRTAAIDIVCDNPDCGFVYRALLTVPQALYLIYFSDERYSYTYFDADDMS